MLRPVERNHGWYLAEMTGDTTPYDVQQFLYRSPWQADAVRDEWRSYVVEHLGDNAAVIVVDAGVARQYSGTAGRIENSHIGVFLTYASRHGAAFIDRWL